VSLGIAAVGGLRTGTMGDGLRPDVPLGPDPVQPIHIVSSADRMDVDTVEVREQADGLHRVVEELRLSAGRLRLVGSSATAGLPHIGDPARQSSALVKDPALSGDIRAARSEVLAVADSLDSLAARTEDFAFGLQSWAAVVDRTNGIIDLSFRTTLAALLLGPGLGLPENPLADVVGRGTWDGAHTARIAPRFVTQPGDAGLAYVYSDGVSRSSGLFVGLIDGLVAPVLGPLALVGLGRTAEGPSSDVARVTSLGGSFVDHRRRRTAGWLSLVGLEEDARALMPWGGTGGEAEAVVDPVGVPGLWTGRSAGLAGEGSGLAGATVPLLAAGGVVAAGRSGVTGTTAAGSPRAAGSSVRSVGDAIRRIEPLRAESGRANRPHVEVLRTDHPDGSRSFVLVVPGTTGDGLVDVHNMMDWGADIELAAGQDSDVLDGITRALEAAGARPGDAVGGAGHSQGGLVLARWMSGEDAARYDVRASVALGAPLANVADPVAGRHVAVGTRDDMVVGYAGDPMPHIPPGGAGGSLTSYSVDTITDHGTETAATSGEAHYESHYIAAWDAIASNRAGDSDVAHVEAEFAEMLGADEVGATTTSIIVELERR
jgi:hypothetical protein